MSVPDTAVAPRWRRFAALGDSFTEGLMDEVRADGRHRGWADRVADELGARAASTGGIEYANLAVRGRLVHQVMAEQVPAVLDLQPDLVSIAVGVNDTLRPSFDVRPVATALDRGVRAVRESGADVLLFAFGDPTRRSRLMAPVRDRIAVYNSAVRAIARHYDCPLVDFWDVAAYDDPQMWDDDWLHLSPVGHEITALCALDALGVGGAHWRTPPVPQPRPRVHRRVAANAAWTTGHLLPWAWRRIRGESSGDDVSPKDPTWIRVPSVASAEQAK